MYNELKEEFIYLKMTYTRKEVMKLISVVVSMCQIFTLFGQLYIFTFIEFFGIQ
jgi:hypothetical protein